MPSEPIALTVSMLAGMLPALLLFGRYPRRLGRVWEPVINLLAGVGAMFPIALTKLELVTWPLGIYAVIYFPLYLVGLLIFNWRQERLSRRNGIG